MRAAKVVVAAAIAVGIVLATSTPVAEPAQPPPEIGTPLMIERP